MVSAPGYAARMLLSLCLAVLLGALLIAPARAAADPFAGVAQSGLALGEPGNAITVYTYVDLQCPFCRTFDRRELPQFVQDYVESGLARIVLRPLAFIGDDSVRAARAVAAAANQNRGWSLAHELFRRQREENSGWVTDRLLRRAAAAVDGLRAGRMMRELGGRRTARRLRRAARAARRAHVDGTPAFTLRLGDSERRLHPARNTAEALENAIQRALPTP
jgi:protein-disulfide isomerase